MRIFKFILTLLAISIIAQFTSCSDASNKSEMQDQTTMNTQDKDYSAAISQQDGTKKSSSLKTAEVTEAPKVIKTANLVLELSDYKQSKSKIDQIIKKWSGYISQENENNSSVRISNNIVIRVPREKFDELVNELITVAETIESKNISSDDVTEEFVDIETRLKNKKEMEKQYLELLKRANTISDILSVDEHVRILREEIEAKEARMKYLNDQVSLSTINMNIYQSFEIDYGFFTKIVQAVKVGWMGLLSFIIGVFYMWPLWFIVVIITYFIIRAKKKRKAKKMELEKQQNLNK